MNFWVKIVWAGVQNYHNQIVEAPSCSVVISELIFRWRFRLKWFMHVFVFTVRLIIREIWFSLTNKFGVCEGGGLLLHFSDYFSLPHYFTPWGRGSISLKSLKKMCFYVFVICFYIIIDTDLWIFFARPRSRKYRLIFGGVVYEIFDFLKPNIWRLNLNKIFVIQFLKDAWNCIISHAYESYCFYMITKTKKNRFTDNHASAQKPEST